MYKLIVSDLDGTLLDTDHRLGRYTCEVFDALQRQGVEVMLASGRHHRDLHGIARQIGSRSGFISINGAAVHDHQGALVDWRAIAPACLDFLLHDPVFDRVHTNVYRIDDWIVERPEPRLLSYHEASGFAYRVVDFAALSDAPVLKVFYYSMDPDHLRQLERWILERHGDDLTTTYALPSVLEVMARGVSKGDALVRVLERLGFVPEEVIAFGDGPNDLELLRYAGKGVLMANADARLKASLPDLEVIGSNAEEAVASYLDRLLGAGAF